MERRDTNEDDEQSFKAKNPIPSSHVPENHHHHHCHHEVAALSPQNHQIYHPNTALQNYHLPQIPISQNHIYQNFPLQNHLYQNPTSQNHLNQNPTSKNHQMNLFSSENELGYPMSVGPSLESSSHLNHNFIQPIKNQSRDMTVNQIYLSTLSHQPQFIENNFVINRGSSSLPYFQQQPLNQMRSKSTSLGQPHANSNVLVDRQHRNIANNTSQNIFALNQFHSGTSNNNDSEINLRHGNQSCGQSSYGYSVRLNSNQNGNRLYLDSQFNWVINGLESTNSNEMPSLYNCQLVGQNSNCFLMEELKGRVASVSKDQDGDFFLVNGLEEQIEIMFLKVKDNLHDLMVNQSAYNLIEKLFAICNEEQMTQLVLSLINNGQRLQKICVHQHGTRALQKMIEHIRTPQQRSLLILALKHSTVNLSKNQNGHHVIQQCLNYFPFDDTKCLIYEIAACCLDVATDKSGCCVLQQSVGRAQGELKERLVAVIATNALILSEHPYGNYVVQYTLGTKIPHANTAILERLKGNFVTLSMNKYGSNVVEKCLKECGREDAAIIIKELMRSPQFLNVLKDPFGNYVAQSALQVSKGDLHHTLVNLIQIHYPYLHSHLYGKMVLAKTRRNKHRV